VRRNTSQVHAVPPNVYPDAMRELVRLHTDKPELVRWIEEGFPTLTEAEHLSRFGEPYKPYRDRK
jgi:hypothetical protein